VRGGLGKVCGYVCLYENDFGSENCSSDSGSGTESPPPGGGYTNCQDACANGADFETEEQCNIFGGGGGNCDSGGILPLMIVRETQYDKLLEGNNVLKIKRDQFILSRKNTNPIRDWTSTSYTSKYTPDDIQSARNTANVTVNDPSVSLDALKLFAEKDISRHQNFGNFSP
jgi:hypothetical protein